MHGEPAGAINGHNPHQVIYKDLVAAAAAHDDQDQERYRKHGTNDAEVVRGHKVSAYLIDPSSELMNPPGAWA